MTTARTLSSPSRPDFRRCFEEERGSSLALVLMTVVLLSGLVLSLASHTLMSRRVQDQDLDLDRAAYIARAGFERVCAEVLLTAANWSILPSTPYTSEVFADGAFDAVVSPVHADRAAVLVRAHIGTTERVLQFEVERRTDAGGATVGLRVDRLSDLTLAQLEQE